MKWVVRPSSLRLLLIGLVVVQVALSVALLWPRSVGGGAGEPAFPDLEAGDIVELTITDSEGTSLRLSSSRGQWVLPDAGDYPARAESVQGAVGGLLALNTARLVTRTEPSHRSLQVADDDFLRRIVFKLADGTTRAVYLGSSPRYGVSHFRVFGQDEVYLTSELQSWDVGTGAASWVDTAYVSIQRTEISQVTLTNVNGTFTFGRDPSAGSSEDGTVSGWSLDGLEPGETLDDARVNSMVNQVASLNLAAPLGREEKAEYGLSQPKAVVTIEASGSTTRLVVGAPAGADYYVVKASSSPYYARVATWSLSQVVDTARQDFLTPPPTPLPEEGIETPSP